VILVTEKRVVVRQHFRHLIDLLGFVSRVGLVQLRSGDRRTDYRLSAKKCPCLNLHMFMFSIYIMIENERVKENKHLITTLCMHYYLIIMSRVLSPCCNIHFLKHECYGTIFSSVIVCSKIYYPLRT
jgi:hypothetical protein